MCKWGTSTVLTITVPAYLSSTGQDKIKSIGVDSCIAPLVEALNVAGILTDASCCGHGNRPGSIILADGRELIISPSREATIEMEKNYPDIHGVHRFWDKGEGDDVKVSFTVSAGEETPSVKLLLREPERCSKCGGVFLSIYPLKECNEHEALEEI